MPSRTPSAELLTQLILTIFQVNGQLLAAGDRLTKDLGLTSALWQVLGAVKETPLTVAQIARNMGLTRQSVRRSAHVLKDRGFVTLQDNPHHQRAKLVVLTREGRTVLGQVAAVQADWSNRIAEGLATEKMQTTIQTLCSLGERL